MSKKRIVQPSIQVHIEELVLHGFDPANRCGIADAVQSELARLFAEQGASDALRRGGEVSHLNAGSFNMASSMKADAIGTQVAQSVYKSLSPNHEHSRSR